MGGRGSSSGISESGKTYGTEYKTLLSSGNVKFIIKTSAESELFETRTRGRVYAEINNRNEIKTIYYFDNESKKTKSIDLRHYHKGINPHVHHGYMHNENGGIKGATRLTRKERKMVELVFKLWYNNNGKS